MTTMGRRAFVVYDDWIIATTLTAILNLTGFSAESLLIFGNAATAKVFVPGVGGRTPVRSTRKASPTSSLDRSASTSIQSFGVNQPKLH